MARPKVPEHLVRQFEAVVGAGRGDAPATAPPKKRRGEQSDEEVVPTTPPADSRDDGSAVAAADVEALRSEVGLLRRDLQQLANQLLQAQGGATGPADQLQAVAGQVETLRRELTNDRAALDALPAAVARAVEAVRSEIGALGSRLSRAEENPSAQVLQAGLEELRSALADDRRQRNALHDAVLDAESSTRREIEALAALLAGLQTAVPGGTRSPEDSRALAAHFDQLRRELAADRAARDALPAAVASAVEAVRSDRGAPPDQLQAVATKVETLRRDLADDRAALDALPEAVASAIEAVRSDVEALGSRLSPAEGDPGAQALQAGLEELRDALADDRRQREALASLLAGLQPALDSATRSPGESQALAAHFDQLRRDLAADRSARDALPAAVAKAVEAVRSDVGALSSQLRQAEESAGVSDLRSELEELRDALADDRRQREALGSLLAGLQPALDGAARSPEESQALAAHFDQVRRELVADRAARDALPAALAKAVEAVRSDVTALGSRLSRPEDNVGASELRSGLAELRDAVRAVEGGTRSELEGLAPLLAGLQKAVAGGTRSPEESRALAAHFDQLRRDLADDRGARDSLRTEVARSVKAQRDELVGLKSLVGDIARRQKEQAGGPGAAATLGADLDQLRQSLSEDRRQRDALRMALIQAADGMRNETQAFEAVLERATQRAEEHAGATKAELGGLVSMIAEVRAAVPEALKTVRAELGADSGVLRDEWRESLAEDRRAREALSAALVNAIDGSRRETQALGIFLEQAAQEGEGRDAGAKADIAGLGSEIMALRANLAQYGAEELARIHQTLEAGLAEDRRNHEVLETAVPRALQKLRSDLTEGVAAVAAGIDVLRGEVAHVGQMPARLTPEAQDLVQQAAYELSELRAEQAARVEELESSFRTTASSANRWFVETRDELFARIDEVAAQAGKRADEVAAQAGMRADEVVAQAAGLAVPEPDRVDSAGASEGRDELAAAIQALRDEVQELRAGFAGLDQGMQRIHDVLRRVTRPKASATQPGTATVIARVARPAAIEKPKG